MTAWDVLGLGALIGFLGELADALTHRKRKKRGRVATFKQG